MDERLGTCKQFGRHVFILTINGNTRIIPITAKTFYQLKPYFVVEG